MLTQVAVVFGNLISLRLAARLMDPADVGEFALVRRILAFLSPLLLLGLGVGLPRSLGRLSDDSRRSAATTVSAWMLGLPALLLLVVIFKLFPARVAQTLFGSATHIALVLPLTLLLAGTQAFLLVYAELRGRLRIRRANVLQFLQIAALPPAVVLALGHRGAHATLVGMGLVTMLVAAVVACVSLRRALRKAPREYVPPALRELAAYGLPRVPGELAFTGLYAIGPILAAHALDLRAAGSLAIGMTLVTALSAAFAPLGLVLLPRLSLALARDGDAAIRSRLPPIVGLSCYGSAFLLVLGAVFGNEGLRHLMGPSYVFAPSCMALLVTSGAANVIFVTLRSLLDACYFRPLNAIHAFVALCTLVLAWTASRWIAPTAPFLSICFAIAASFVTLSGLTLAAVARRFRLSATPATLLRWLGVQAVLFLPSLAIKHVVTGASCWVVLATQVGLFATWIIAMKVFGIRWPGELRDYVTTTLHRKNGPQKMVPREPPEALHAPSSTSHSRVGVTELVDAALD